ncbi:MAG: hypothetical protein EPN38_12585 [Rhodanobacteraceae bacterium]|nr:MAG: hypothetical protein EPN38_12585 [Rhodanobacteraceae bacterium]
MEERALSPTARLVLMYLLALTGRPGWIIYVGQVRAALGLGRYAWMEARKQLECLGYYWSERQQDADGTWTWVHVVSDTREVRKSLNTHEHHPPNPSIVGFPVDGPPVDGFPDDIRSKKGRTNKRRTTTYATSVDAARSLAWPPALSEAEVVVAGGLISELPAVAQQQLLDELAGAMARAGTIHSSPVHYLMGLVRKQRAGEFHLALGADVAKERVRATEEELRRQARVEAKRKRDALAQTPAARSAAQKAMQECAAALGIRPTNTVWR